VKILAVDPGITTGLALIEYHEARGSWTCLGRWDLRPDTEERRQALSVLFGELYETTHNDGSVEPATVDVIVMEELLAYRKTSADEKVEAQAIVKLLSYDCGPIPLVTYAPATVRSAVCGTGRADEKGVRDTLRFLLRMPKRAKKGEALSPHQQDAVAVALCHLRLGAGLQVLDRCEEVSA